MESVGEPTHKENEMASFLKKLHCKLYQAFEEQVISVLYKLLQDYTQRGNTSPTFWRQLLITLILKSDKNTTGKLHQYPF